jgi:predicted acyl esterase
MRIDWDVPITMTDGVTLRTDLFRPVENGSNYPVIMTHGPYAKGLAFQEGYPGMWKTLSTEHPQVLAGSSNKY